METDALARPKTPRDEVQVFGTMNSVLKRYTPNLHDLHNLALTRQRTSRVIAFPSLPALVKRLNRLSQMKLVPEAASRKDTGPLTVAGGERGVPNTLINAVRHSSTAQQMEPSVSRMHFVLFFAGAWAFLYLRTFLLPATPFAATDDQSLFFARAARIIQGQVPYRDFFEIVTPGTDLIYAAGFRLFGIHAWIMPIWIIAMGLAFSLVITYIAAKIIHGPSVWLPALLFLVFDFNSALDLTHQWFSTFAALAMAAVLMGGLSMRRIFSASLLCAMAILFTQTKGTLVFVGVAFYLVGVTRAKAGDTNIGRRLALFILPVLLTVTCVLGYYIYKSGFQPVLFDLVIFPPRYMTVSEVNTPRTYIHQLAQLFDFRSPSAIAFLIPAFFIYALVPYVYGAGLYQLWRRRAVLSSTVQRNLILLHVVGLGLFLAIANGPRHFRLCTVAAPAILIFVWLLTLPIPGGGYIRKLSWVLAGCYFLLLPIYRQVQWHDKLDLPIGRTAFTDKELFHKFQWVAERTHPSDGLFNDSALTLYLSLHNPTQTEFVTYDETTRPEQMAAIVQALKRNPPAYIALFPVNLGSTVRGDHAAPFRQFVYDNYSLAHVFSQKQSRFEEELWRPTLSSKER